MPLPGAIGGPYPLLRVTARFLGVSHNQLIVPFRNLAGDAEPDFDADGIWQGTCIVRGAEDDEGEPDWAAIWKSGW